MCMYVCVCVCVCVCDCSTWRHLRIQRRHPIQNNCRPKNDKLTYREYLRPEYENVRKSWSTSVITHGYGCHELSKKCI